MALKQRSKEKPLASDHPSPVQRLFQELTAKSKFLQQALPGKNTAKETVGHRLYEEWRSIERDPNQQERAQVLAGEMVEVYTAAALAAIESATSRSNSAAGISLSYASFIEVFRDNPLAAPPNAPTGSTPGAQAIGMSSTSKNLVPVGNSAALVTSVANPGASGNQAISITAKNIAEFAGNVDFAALAAQKDNLDGAFNLSLDHQIVPLSSLVSNKNEILDPKFLAGAKKDPRQNAADWIMKAIDRDPAAKKREPLDVRQNADGSRMDDLEDRVATPIPMTGKKSNKPQEEPMRTQLCEKFGVDLTAVEGVSIQTCLAFLSEVGTDVGKFASAEHFASWMGLCPDNRITGGRTHAAHTRKVQNRLANSLRMAAQSLHRSKAGLGDWFRRLKAKLGTKAAVTAAAHKLARILWAMVKHRRPYDPSRLGNPEMARIRKERYLRRQAEQLGFALTPVGGEVS